MSIPVTALLGRISGRSYNCLVRQFETVEQVADASDEDLLRLRSFGPISLNEVRPVIADMLGRSHPDPWRRRVGTRLTPEQADTLTALLVDVARQADPGLAERAVQLLAELQAVAPGTLP